MAVSKTSVLFFKYDEFDLVLFVLLSSNVKSCNSCLNSTKFFLRAVVESKMSYNCSNICQSFAAINLNAIIPRNVLKEDQGIAVHLLFLENA